MEYPIETAAVKHIFPSLPNCYKVDIAYPELKLAIEVDGLTHKLRKWRFLDQRKEAVLSALGWSVLRFWNWDVDNDLSNCVQVVLSSISKSKSITTTSQMAS